MTKRENIIVRIASKVIEKFIRDWKKTPYVWDKEADVHAEIYSRISSALKCYRLTPSKCEKYWQKRECLNWVYCKPYTYYKKYGKKGGSNMDFRHKLEDFKDKKVRVFCAGCQDVKEETLKEAEMDWVLTITDIGREKIYNLNQITAIEKCYK